MRTLRFFASVASALFICFFCGSVLAGAPELKDADDVLDKPVSRGGNEPAARNASLGLKPGLGKEIDGQDAPDRDVKLPLNELLADAKVEGASSEGQDSNVSGRGAQGMNRAMDAKVNAEGIRKPAVPAAAPANEAPQMEEGVDAVERGGVADDEKNGVESDFTGESPRQVVGRMRDLTKQSIKKDDSRDNVLQTLIRHVDELERYLLSSDSNPGKPRDAHLANAVNMNECRVTMAKLREQSRAFDELLKEKSRLSKMLVYEQDRLMEYQRKAQSPELGEWLRKRSARLQAYFDTPETDAVSYYAKRFVESELSAAHDGLSLLESKLERTVDVVLPARYGSLVASVLTVLIASFPIAVTTRYMHTLSRSLSLRQCVFLGNLFLASYAIGVGLLGLILRQDPLVTLYDSAENMFILLQLGLAVAYFGILFLLALTLRAQWHERTAGVFGAELIFYVAVGYHYHGRIWGPTMLGRQLGTSPALYLIYIVDFCAMVALTISTVESGNGADPEARLLRDMKGLPAAGDRGDVEIGGKGD